MRRLTANEALCIGCHRCEEVCATLYFKADDRQLSAIRVAADAAGQPRVTVCTQCGVCRDVCPTGAIVADKIGVLRVNKAKCEGCLACARFCPSGAMFHAPGELAPFKCVACGACAKVCPTNALSIASGP